MHMHFSVFVPIRFSCILCPRPLESVLVASELEVIHKTVEIETGLVSVQAVTVSSREDMPR